MTIQEQFSNLNPEKIPSTESFPYEELDITEIVAADHIEVEMPEQELHLDPGTPFAAMGHSF